MQAGIALRVGGDAELGQANIDGKNSLGLADREVQAPNWQRIGEWVYRKINIDRATVPSRQRP
jgi:hypothetical protein